MTSTPPTPFDAGSVDTSVPHSARIWNYWLGGKDNYPVDREAGDRFLDVFPGIAQVARESRSFLRRTVRHLAEDAGMRQFLDIGTGLPTQDNTHEVAQAWAPDCRVVYVDNDPLVLTHARALMAGSPEGATEYLHADLRDPEAILEAASATLDFDRPVALMLMGVLGHVADLDEARDIVGRLLAGLPSGSHLTINDGTNVVSEANVKAQDEYNDSGAVPYIPRTPDEIASFFTGLEVVDPGVVMVTRWRPEQGEGPFQGGPPEVDGFGGVGRKP